MTIKLAVLASGNGSNFEAIARHFQNRADIKITCISDNSDSRVLERARNLGVDAIYLPFEDNYKYFSENKYDLYVMAGYMRILPEDVLSFGTFINIHPSLLPAFKGLDAIKQAYDYGVKITGITIHYAQKEVDAGKIIVQSPVQIEADMNLQELEEGIHEEEHRLYPLVIESLLYEKIVEFQAAKSKCSGSKSGSGCSGCKGGSGCGS